MGPQAAICRFTSGFTFQPQMRYPVLVQISGFHGFQEQEDYVINRAKYLSLVNIHFDVFEPAVGNQDNTIKLRGEVQRCDLISITKGTKSDIFHV